MQKQNKKHKNNKNHIGGSNKQKAHMQCALVKRGEKICGKCLKAAASNSRNARLHTCMCVCVC